MTAFASLRSALCRLAAGTALAGATLAFPLTAHAGAGAVGIVAPNAPTVALPSGGTVASGSATIATGSRSVTVNQSTNRAIINWSAFNVAVGNAVVFNQPNASSATLNRVTGTTASTIAGQISSNGAVYLVNPNGIAITATGNVQTGGGFIASTLDIANADFNAGKLAFTGVASARGSSKAVTNAGSITTSAGGYVALLGGSVSNAGTIIVPAGKVALGSGESIALDLNGGGFLQVAVPSNLAGASVSNSGIIMASGGRIELKAATAASAVRNVINMTGTLSADSASGDGGSIVLLGGDGGTTSVTGTISAKANGASGNGGFVETSGAKIAFTGAKITTSSRAGKAGTWLIDPNDLTVDASAAATIASNLASGNVTLQTTSTTATGTGTQSAGNGDIIINSGIVWTSANTLSLLAYRNIAINATISGATTGGLTLTAGNGVANTGSISDSGNIQIGTFNLTNGAWSQVNASLPNFAATDFRFDYSNASFLRAAGGSGTSADPYMIADVYGLQGLASSTLLANSFVIVQNIDASGTANWNAGAGFNPIGRLGGAGAFTGNFDGRGNVINGLFINNTLPIYVGLFGAAQGALSNIGLTGTNITSVDTGAIGGLVGQLYSGGSITNSYVTGSVTGLIGGSGNVGGLVGILGGAVSTSHSDAIVGGYTTVGNLVGYVQSGGTVDNSYATGTVSGKTVIGGLVGSNQGTITNSHATGNVTATGNTIGGLVGQSSNPSTIIGSYATGNVMSTGTNVGGLVGFLSATTINTSYATGTVTSTSTNAASSVGGLIGKMSSTGSLTARINDSYATGNATSAGQDVGGLVGQVVGASFIARSYATGAALGTNNLGGLVGLSGLGTTISDVYASGAVGAAGSHSAVGGLVGSMQAGGTIANAYATGTVTGSNTVGGLVGDQQVNASITSSYATGAVSGTTRVGGLVGSSTSNSNGTNYWDTYSTGQSLAVGNGSSANAVAVTSDPNGSPNAYAKATYGNLADGSASVGGSTPSGFVFVAGDSTRPFLAFEVPTGNTVINSHQFQLLGYNASTNASNYTLTNDIDLAETGAVKAGNPGSYAGMWSAAGFVPLGTDGKGNTWDGTGYKLISQITSNIYGFSGSLTGNGFAISNLNIVRPTAQNTGLFGVYSGFATGLSVTGTVSGYNGAGGIAGLLWSTGSIYYSTSAVNVSGNNLVGGLVGNATNGSQIGYSGATGSATSTTGGDVGGLVGYASGAGVLYSTASGNASGKYFVGGLIGYAYNSSIQSSLATGDATASIDTAGGLIGVLNGGSLGGSTATGTATAPKHADVLVGQAINGAAIN